MAKHPTNDDLELEAIRTEIRILNKRMEEVITILGGNSAYDVKGIRADVKDLKTAVQKIEEEIEDMKREDEERDMKRAFFSIKLETIPQKIVGIVTFIIMLLTILQSIRTLFNPK